MAIFAPDLGIDLGTSNTLLYVRGRGIVINEPTVVVVNAANKNMIRAVGDEAKYLLGRTSDSLMAVRPVRAGRPEDIGITRTMLKYFIRKAIGVSYLVKPRAVVSIPANYSAVNRQALTKAVMDAGCKSVQLVEKSFAAAIGSGLPTFETVGSMVVDIGGGTTDVAIVSIGGTVISQSVAVGGEALDAAIINYIKREFNMLIGDRTAEEIKLDLASAMPLGESRRVKIRGRDLLSPQAMEIDFSSQQAYEAVREGCMAILQTIKWVLERTPPELASDVMRNGIHLTGGGAQLYALDQMIGSSLGIPVQIARDPEDATAMGLGYLVENLGRNVN